MTECRSQACVRHSRPAAEDEAVSSRGPFIGQSMRLSVGDTFTTRIDELKVWTQQRRNASRHIECPGLSKMHHQQAADPYPLCHCVKELLVCKLEIPPLPALEKGLVRTSEVRLRPATEPEAKPIAREES